MASPSTEALDELLLSPSWFQDPYRVYARLRSEAPVHWCAPWGQWLVTGHADVSFILRQPALFSSRGWEERFLTQLPPGVLADELPTVARHYQTRVLSNTDPPEHTRLRKLVSKSFTPRVIEALRPRIVAIVDEMVSDLAECETVDLISRFAYPLPATVIALLFGAPFEDCHLFEQWSHDIVSFVGSGSPQIELARREESSLRKFRAYLDSLIETRGGDAQDDLLSLLISRSDDGDALSHDELISTCITILFAGHETTANLIGNMVHALLQEPARWAEIVADPDLAGAAVEETLRYDSPVQRVRRVARADIALGGQQIRAGELVMGFLGSANHDPEVFPHPEAFDLRRATERQTAFGGGVHFCVGAALSRLEAPIALRGLSRRFPRLCLNAETAPAYRQNMTFRGLESLVVDLCP